MTGSAAHTEPVGQQAKQFLATLTHGLAETASSHSDAREMISL
jgi:hypothetical protein